MYASNSKKKIRKGGTNYAQRRHKKEKDEKSWCDKNRRATWVRMLREKLNR